MFSKQKLILYKYKMWSTSVLTTFYSKTLKIVHPVSKNITKTLSSSTKIHSIEVSFDLLF